LLALTFNLANALGAQGRTQWAEELYALINGRLPGFPESHGNLALLRQAAGRHTEAEALWRLALAGDSLATSRRMETDGSLPSESSH
jgi:tetratricopeptide (TPR) repeat protein